MRQKKSSITYQRFRILDVDHTHALNFFGSKQTELDLLDGAQRRLRIWEEYVRHIGEVVIIEDEMKNAGDNRSGVCVEETGINEGARVVNVAKTGVTDVIRS